MRARFEVLGIRFTWINVGRRVCALFAAAWLAGTPAVSWADDPADASATAGTSVSTPGIPDAPAQKPDALAAPSRPLLPSWDDTGRPFLGEGYRYGRLNVVSRALVDLVAIPANMPSWTVRDWGTFGTVGATVALMMVPFPVSADVALQEWVHQNVGEWRLKVWTPVTEVLLWGSVGGGMLASLAYGYFADAPPYLEVVSLMSEAFVIGQLYQFAFKLSLGREGPMNGDGQGVIYGPSASLGLFPAGTPSGHASSFFALLGAMVTYVDLEPVTIAAHLFGLVFAASLIISDYHFVSDVIWGAAMGFAAGEWVVRHRSTKWRYVGGEPVKLSSLEKLTPDAVMPYADARRGGGGLMAIWRF